MSCVVQGRKAGGEGGRDGEEVQMGLWVVIGAFFFLTRGAGTLSLFSSTSRVDTNERREGMGEKNAIAAHREQAGMSGIPSPPELLRILR